MCYSYVQYNQNINYRFFSSWVIFLLFISMIILLSSQLRAQGNLLVFPHRVVFDGQKRVIEMNIANAGQDSAKYNISFLQYRSTEDGAYEKITVPDPGQKFADKYIRFLPRTVMLGPNETQVVLLQLTKSEQLEPGEYRSHLYFKALRNHNKTMEEGSVKKDTTIMSVKIEPIFSITVPVLIRVGESTTTVKLTDLKLEKAVDGSNKLTLSINRSGNMSAYGDILVSHIAPNGKETKVGLLNGIAVYTPNSLRRLTINLENKSSVDLSKGTIRVLYSSQSDKRTEKLADAELAL